MKEIRFIGPSEHLTDARRACQRSVNLYMARGEGLGEDRQVMLESAPGLQTFLTLTGNDMRGAHVVDDRWFVVAGAGLYEVLADASYSLRGTLNSTLGYVGMSGKRDQLIVVDGDDGYALTLASNVFAEITDPDWRGSNWVEELDGYSIFVAPGTDQFYLSSIDDGSDMDALDFSSADASVDGIVTHRVRKRELFLFGGQSVEVWVNSGGGDFPLTRYNSTPIDIGIVGAQAVASTLDALYYIGQSTTGRGYVYEMTAHQPVRVSTKAVEQALSSSTDMSQATMWTYHTDGAEFVGVNAPGLGSTWVFDTATRTWHERGELVDGEWTPLRTEFVSHYAGVHYALADDSIYTMSGQTIAGSPMTRERTLPHLVNPALEPVSYRAVELACTAGEGGNITLEISNDGGRTFGPPLQRSLGVIGRAMQRIRWLGLGTSLDRVFRLRITDDVPFCLYSGTVQT